MSCGTGKKPCVYIRVWYDFTVFATRPHSVPGKRCYHRAHFDTSMNVRASSEPVECAVGSEGWMTILRHRTAPSIFAPPSLHRARLILRILPSGLSSCAYALMAHPTSSSLSSLAAR